MEGDEKQKKVHRPRQAGTKAEKKKAKNPVKPQEMTDRQKNPKAFAINSAIRAERKFRRKEDMTAKRQHVPLVDKTPAEPPPMLVAVVGPPKVGKTTLIQNLIKSFTKTNVTSINGPITLVTSKKRRITLIECNNDINCMIDIAKCADLVLLLCDASFGFEMEIFEFLNICQVHGMPKIMGVLTHLDMIKNTKVLKRRKKELKHRFWTEVYSGAKLFYLSGIIHGEYLRNEITNLGRFISVMKFRPLTWRGAHSYILADRMEDVTGNERIRKEPQCARDVILYGYVRGVPMTKECMVHIAGLGDVRIDELSVLDDPCPLPSAEKKRNLLERERLLYAPMSGVGGIVYDKDAVYIELQGSHSHRASKNPEQDEILSAFIDKKQTVDEQMENQEFKFFSDGQMIKSNEFKKHEHAEASDESSDEEDNDSGLENQDSDIEEKIKEWNGSDEEEEQGSEEDDESSDEEYDDIVPLQENAAESGEEEIDKAEVESEDEKEPSGLEWKEGIAKRARDAYLDRQTNSQNLMKIVYGVFSKGARKEKDEQKYDQEKIGGLFKLAAERQSQLQKDKIAKDMDECCFFESYGNGDRNWLSEENMSAIKNCFVTGKWRASEDAKELLRLDEMSDAESEVYGDFEDLETGEAYAAPIDVPKADTDATTKSDNPKKRPISRVEERNMTKTELMAKKMKLKAKFDSEYDNPDEVGRITGDHQYYESLKAEALRQSELNKKEFVDLDDDMRIQIEGHRSGLYVRMGFKSLPYEFVDHFDPTYPVLIGGLNMAEENIGYVSCKVKKHRWYKKILKTKDPLIVSMGWRRFQTVALFSKMEDNFKQRYLKYTPNHVTCSMTFWGPITPQNTGFLAVQTLSQDSEELKRIGFRIAATGCVTEMDKTTQIMKKLKLIGSPSKIFQKSAFVQDMFNSSLEVAKFEGAKIKTVSGIRGIIKKALRTPEGAFRATFEDKILMSDIVFCRTWFKVDVPKFYSTVTSLLLAPGKKSEWCGMKTVGQLRREQNIRNEANQDSAYTEIVRKPKVFRPLKIPKQLQKALPYKTKPKFEPKSPKERFDKNRIAVVHTTEEKKISTMMKMLQTNYADKKKKDKRAAVERKAKYRQEKTAIEMKKLRRQKELKKKIYRTLSKLDIAKEKAAQKSRR